jgi:predicted nucleic acid-binding protein
MHKQRIYIDTSVIGGCFDIEFEEWSNILFDEFIEGEKIVVVSDVVFDELLNAPRKVREKLDQIETENVEIHYKDSEVAFLASKYIEFGAISENSLNDAYHLAIATVFNVDVLVSWNFKHIVNLDRILKYNSINLMFGYKILEIRNPKEVISNEKGF